MGDSTSFRSPTSRLAVGLVLVALTAPVSAQVPGEIQGVTFDDPTNLSWAVDADADTYNVYRGTMSLLPGSPGRCHRYQIGASTVVSEPVPDVGQGYFYLVTGESTIDGEGIPGTDSGGAPRPLLGSCAAVMETHAVDRLGYGWSEWADQRIDALGLDGYIAEQLVPSSIDESTNTELADALSGIDPPNDIFQLIQQQVIRGVYARRQLEQQVAVFFFNHFNTYWLKVSDIFRGVYPECQAPGDPENCDPAYPYLAYQATSYLQNEDLEKFRGFAFEGNFRDMLEQSTLSTAMIIYLDTYLSIAGNPNENFPRELMELHSMGVDGGYTQLDVQELSRIITGWSACRKIVGHGIESTPTDPCVPTPWEPDAPPTEWVAHFISGNYDCTAKTMFAGTPEEFTIPSTCPATPAEGVADLYTALDHIAEHPSTARYLSTKLLQRFVTDEPDQSMIDALVAVWDDAGNPHGKGDIQAVLTAAFNLDAFNDPDRAASKIKSPLEHAVSSLRGVRGETDGLTRVLDFLIAAQHIPHYNPVPTGYPEDGESWIGTTNMLERQNYGVSLAWSGSPGFNSDPIGLLNDNGVSTGPGNADAIVGFFSNAFFGGALTPAEKQAAIDYLNTDVDGVPSPYDDQRIRDVVAVLLGYPQFQEQ